MIFTQLPGIYSLTGDVVGVQKSGSYTLRDIGYFWRFWTDWINGTLTNATADRNTNFLTIQAGGVWESVFLDTLNWRVGAWSDFGFETILSAGASATLEFATFDQITDPPNWILTYPGMDMNTIPVRRYIKARIQASGSAVTVDRVALTWYIATQQYQVGQSSVVNQNQINPLSQNNPIICQNLSPMGTTPVLSQTTTLDPDNLPITLSTPTGNQIHQEVSYGDEEVEAGTTNTSPYTESLNPSGNIVVGAPYWDGEKFVKKVTLPKANYAPGGHATIQASVNRAGININDDTADIDDVVVMIRVNGGVPQRAKPFEIRDESYFLFQVKLNTDLIGGENTIEAWCETGEVLTTIVDPDPDSSNNSFITVNGVQVRDVSSGVLRFSLRPPYPRPIENALSRKDLPADADIVRPYKDLPCDATVQANGYKDLAADADIITREFEDLACDTYVVIPGSTSLGSNVIVYRPYRDLACSVMVREENLAFLPCDLSVISDNKAHLLCDIVIIRPYKNLAADVDVHRNPLLPANADIIKRFVLLDCKAEVVLRPSESLGADVVVYRPYSDLSAQVEVTEAFHSSLGASAEVDSNFVVKSISASAVVSSLGTPKFLPCFASVMPHKSLAADTIIIRPYAQIVTSAVPCNALVRLRRDAQSFSETIFSSGESLTIDFMTMTPIVASVDDTILVRGKDPTRIETLPTPAVPAWLQPGETPGTYPERLPDNNDPEDPRADYIEIPFQTGLGNDTVELSGADSGPTFFPLVEDNANWTSPVKLTNVTSPLQSVSNPFIGERDGEFLVGFESNSDVGGQTIQVVKTPDIGYRGEWMPAKRLEGVGGSFADGNLMFTGQDGVYEWVPATPGNEVYAQEIKFWPEERQSRQELRLSFEELLYEMQKTGELIYPPPAWGMTPTETLKIQCKELQYVDAEWQSSYANPDPYTYTTHPFEVFLTDPRDVEFEAHSGTPKYSPNDVAGPHSDFQFIRTTQQIVIG